MISPCPKCKKMGPYTTAPSSPSDPCDKCKNTQWVYVSQSYIGVEQKFKPPCGGGRRIFKSTKGLE